MDVKEIEQRIATVALQAQGRWTEILRALRVAPHVLSGKLLPCPLRNCAHAGRFRYSDEFGMGNYQCTRCGPGGGFKLLHGLHGGGMLAVLRAVESYLGMREADGQECAAASSGKEQRLIQELLAQSQPVRRGDPVDRYLRRLGVGMTTYPAALRCHAELPFYDRDPDTGVSRLVCCTPALLAMMEGCSPAHKQLYRLYLLDDAPAFGSRSAKMLGHADGGACRLAAPAGTLALASDLVTALAVQLRTGQAVWCAMQPENLARLWVPDGIRRVRIYCEHSPDYRVQSAAYTLARRCVKYRLALPEVYVPRHPGDTWAEVWVRSTQNCVRAA
ncbi:DUF7146 domain-containing protein [Rugamonas aquatica]|uniref:DNA primase/helicase Gp4 N-terminal Bacteriophage T7-like domain-containing protein n=1 Tax=Rugamonas aquatica TaxID=2743357 RepID=A0A6A7N6H3_9BURK|nr:hypothetical protein [Rugamonas aquatica]MQA40636.1 hypothetical protein [Rugamonas aquatica]